MPLPLHHLRHLLRPPTLTHLLTLQTRTMTTAAAARLSGKTILITGASSGIGRSTALEFARTAKDIRLILTARRESTLLEVKGEIEKIEGWKGSVLARKFDVSRREEVRELLPALEKEGWVVDVLVNNAGLVKGVERVGDIAEEDIEVMYNTNVTGLINLTNVVVKSLKARGGHGDIINVGSIAGREPYVGGSIYCSTKAAVRAFTDSLRRELIDTRIRVIEIDPGQVETEFSVVRFRGDKEAAKKVYAGCDPLTPDDIAEVIVFTASRRENVVVADVMIFPQHQAGAGAVYRKP